jgi:cysteine desulfurase
VRAQITGGGQEKGRRSGTENAAGVVGLAKALELAVARSEESVGHMERLRNRLERELLAAIDGLRVTGARSPRNANTTHLTLPGIEAEPLLVHLDRAGIACSSGSACSTGALEPSHVLMAMGVAPERLYGALRLSLSHESTDDDIDHVLAVLPPAVARLRELTEPGV